MLMRFNYSEEELYSFRQQLHKTITKEAIMKEAKGGAVFNSVIITFAGVFYVFMLFEIVTSIIKKNFISLASQIFICIILVPLVSILLKVFLRGESSVTKGKFFIVEDTISNKYISSDADSNTIYYLIGERYGSHRVSSEIEYLATKVGEKIFVVFADDGSEKEIMAFPEPFYSLSPELSQYMRNDFQKGTKQFK